MAALIIGTGSIGRRHLGHLRELAPEMRIRFLRRDAREDDLSREYDATVHATLEEALAEKPELAVVATPSALHAEVLPDLIRANVPLYAEKPVVTTREDLQQVRALLNDYSAPSLSGCNMRFLPCLQKAREMIRSGAIGNVVRAQLQAGRWLPDWRSAQDYRASYSANPDLGGGVLFDLIHELDQARWFFGELDVFGACLGKFSSLEIRSEDTAAVLMGKRDGGPAIGIQLDYVSRALVRRYEFVGEEGTLVWDLPGKTLSILRADGTENLDAGSNAFDMFATYSRAWEEFLESVSTGNPTSQDIAEGLRSTELAIRAKEVAPA